MNGLRHGLADYMLKTPILKPSNSITMVYVWCGTVISIYAISQAYLSSFESTSTLPAPQWLYTYSEVAFATATFLHIISSIFENTKEKRQLALLSVIIKGLSWHSDWLINNDKTALWVDAFGSTIIPARYIQWSCTTPTIIYTISLISDLTSTEVYLTVFSDWLMIIMGYIAAMYKSYTALFVSFMAFYNVLYNVYRMLNGAIKATESSAYTRRCLNITLYLSMIVWHLFPIGWLMTRIPGNGIGEVINIFANFGAKIIFSSCIVYNNFISIHERHVRYLKQKEHDDRLSMVHELNESIKNKDEFVSVIGHELKTPISAIMQLSSAIINNNAIDYKNINWAKTIRKSAVYLMSVVNDILDYKTATVGLNLNFSKVDIKSSIDHVFEIMIPNLNDRVIMKSVYQDDNEDISIVADRNRLIQILTNIIGNAVKFTTFGVVTVHVSTASQNVIIRVRDTGCGISEDRLDEIVKPFTLSDMSLGRKHGIIGLGLSIANQLIKAHRGRIEIESRLGEGTSVVISLPMTQEGIDEKDIPVFDVPSHKGLDMVREEIRDGPPTETIALASTLYTAAPKDDPSVEPSVNPSASSKNIYAYLKTSKKPIAILSVLRRSLDKIRRPFGSL